MSAQGFALGDRRTIARKLGDANWLLLALVAAIVAVGVVVLTSVAGGSFEPWAQRHLERALVGIALVLCMAVVPLSGWLALAFPLYLVSLVLLALVPLMGHEALGARRWIGLGAVSFQPAELMKIALVLMLARYYQALPAEKVSRPLWVALPAMAIGLPVVFVLKQPDLGTAVLFAAVGLAILFLAGVRFAYLAGLAATIALVSPFIWQGLHGYQKARILTFLDPERDPLGTGYHILQSKIALGSGGLNGKGYGMGTQSHLDFLPEKHTDFIFTMFAEEAGFVGSVSLLLLYMLLLAVLAHMAMKCRSQFARLLIAGFGLVIFIYVFINVAMVTGLAPVVGVPLPLVSYGGTSMMTVMFGLGLAMSAHVHRRITLKPEDLRHGW